MSGCSTQDQHDNPGLKALKKFEGSLFNNLLKLQDRVLEVTHNTQKVLKDQGSVDLGYCSSFTKVARIDNAPELD